MPTAAQRSRGTASTPQDRGAWPGRDAGYYNCRLISRRSPREAGRHPSRYCTHDALIVGTVAEKLGALTHIAFERRYPNTAGAKAARRGPRPISSIRRRWAIWTMPLPGQGCNLRKHTAGTATCLVSESSIGNGSENRHGRMRCSVRGATMSAAAALPECLESVQTIGRRRNAQPGGWAFRARGASARLVQDSWPRTTRLALQARATTPD